MKAGKVLCLLCVSVSGLRLKQGAEELELELGGPGIPDKIKNYPQLKSILTPSLNHFKRFMHRVDRSDGESTTQLSSSGSSMKWPAGTPTGWRPWLWSKSTSSKVQGELDELIDEIDGSVESSPYKTKPGETWMLVDRPQGRCYEGKSVGLLVSCVAIAGPNTPVGNPGGVKQPYAGAHPADGAKFHIYAKGSCRDAGYPIKPTSEDNLRAYSTKFPMFCNHPSYCLHQQVNFQDKLPDHETFAGQLAVDGTDPEKFAEIGDKGAGRIARGLQSDRWNVDHYLENHYKDVAPTRCY